MSKRNFTILIIVLAIILIAIFGFLFLHRLAPAPQTPGTGINFVSQFNPPGQNNTITPPSTTPPSNTPVTEPPVVAPALQLVKVSSMPVAGFTVFQKERYKVLPVAIPATIPTPAGVGTPTASVGATPPVTTPPATTSKTKTKTVVVKPTPPPTEFVPALRYVARTNGNIYETFADSINELQFSTTVVPKVHESFFGNNGNSVLMRYLNTDGATIDTFAGTLPTELLGGDTTSNTQVKGSFLPENITDMSVSSDGSKIFYLLNVNTGDSVVGITSGLLGDKKVQIFDSPFTEWLSQWPSAKMITLTTKPSSLVPGYMYMINPDTKNLTRVLGGINGLTTLTSPDGKSVLYAGGNLSLDIYNISTGNVTPVSVRTMPEKCVWGSASTTVYCAVPKAIGNATYPDDWYKGEVSFSDDFWKIDAASGTGTMIFDPTTIRGGQSIDGIKLALDTGEKYLFFVNKKDSYLWELSLQ
jgi:hypothetical protein